MNGPLWAWLAAAAGVALLICADLVLTRGTRGSPRCAAAIPAASAGNHAASGKGPRPGSPAEQAVQQRRLRSRGATPPGAASAASSSLSSVAAGLG